MAETRPKPRSKCRLYADVLRAIKQSDQVKITHILHAANIPYDRLVAYLEQMEKNGLIERVGEGNSSYVITQKGLHYLDEFRKLDEFSRIFGVEV